jgi:predicted alpha-1,6-mannanase (GH76 family)
VKGPLRLLAAAALVAVAGTVLAACGTAPGPTATTTAPAPSPTPTVPLPAVPGKGRAASALAAFNRAFLLASPGKAYYRMSTNGGHATFYKQAELIEMTQDAWLRSHAPAYKGLMTQLYKGLMAQSRTLGAWLSHSNDDILWAAIMSLRAYKMTGNRMYLLQARNAFDATYARSWSAQFGGGLWGSFRHRAKNTCVSLPASVVASMLYQDLHDPSYLKKARQLYAWVRRTLYDPRTGAVYDHVAPQAGGGMTVDRTTWTYNQGIFIGAADQLYRITKDRSYYQDALRTLAFTKADLTVNGILKSEVAPGSSLIVSSGGYKGIFVRWAMMFINRYHVAGYDAWMRQNAAEVLKHANAAGLMNEDWSTQTGTGPLSAFSCSSAVVLLQWAPSAAKGSSGPAPTTSP